MNITTPAAPPPQSGSNHPVKTLVKIRSWKAAISAVLALLVSLTAILALIYQAGWLLPAPDIRFIQSGPLKVGDVFVEGVTIFNRGSKSANKVEIIITHNASEIEGSYDEDSFLTKPDISTANNDKRIIFKLDRISPKKESGMIYITYPVKGAGETTVDVRYDEGEGKPGIYERTWEDTIFVGWGLFSSIICIWLFGLRKILIRILSK